MKIYSWNVNGLRACVRKGFLDWLEASEADIVGLQEVRALPEQLTVAAREPKGWHAHFNPAERKGYSGVGIYSRSPLDTVSDSVDVEAFDIEGRVQIAEIGELKILNVYFPNGSGKNRDLSRIPYKLDFYAHLRQMLASELASGARILVMGDFNTAHREIDLARPKQNKATSGFLIEEREELDRWMGAGWIDSFRRFEPGAGHYSWWSQRGTARERNVGWRIDYVLASPNLGPFLRGAFIQPDVPGSDHAPIGVELDPSVLS